MSIRTCANLRARKPKRPTSFWHDRLRSHDLSQLPYSKPILVKDSAICFAFFSARLTWCFVIRGFQYFHLVGNRNSVYSTSGGMIIQDQILLNLWAILLGSKVYRWWYQYDFQRWHYFVEHGQTSKKQWYHLLQKYTTSKSEHVSFCTTWSIMSRPQIWYFNYTASYCDPPRSC